MWPFAELKLNSTTRTRHGPDTDKVRARCRVRAKFHYTDPTGPSRTQRSFAAKKVRAGPCGSGRVRVVEFSSSPTMCADFVRVGSGPCRVRVVEFSYYSGNLSSLLFLFWALCYNFCEFMANILNTFWINVFSLVR